MVIPNQKAEGALGRGRPRRLDNLTSVTVPLRHSYIQASLRPQISSGYAQIFEIFALPP